MTTVSPHKLKYKNEMRWLRLLEKNLLVSRKKSLLITISTQKQKFRFSAMRLKNFSLKLQFKLLTPSVMLFLNALHFKYLQFNIIFIRFNSLRPPFMTKSILIPTSVSPTK